MHGAHAARPTRKRTSSRKRLMVVILAPAVVLLPLTAQATIGKAAKPAKTVAATAKVTKPAAKVTRAVTTLPGGWRRTWSPPLALLSDYVPGHPSPAGFKTLSSSFGVLGSQQVVAVVRFKTRWVDIKALTDGPNIAQQGYFSSAAQFKLQIFHGATPGKHRAQCRIKGTTGYLLAFGPKIDVADGNWHTLTCVKSRDGASSTKVTVTVDGVPGRTLYSRTPIGDVLPTGRIMLGGRSATAGSDSLDGWIGSLSYTVT